MSYAKFSMPWFNSLFLLNGLSQWAPVGAAAGGEGKWQMMELRGWRGNKDRMETDVAEDGSLRTRWSCLALSAGLGP